MNPDLLDQGDSWWWHCRQPFCAVETQGGIKRLDAHTVTVHGDDVVPFGTPGRRP